MFPPFCPARPFLFPFFLQDRQKFIFIFLIQIMIKILLIVLLSLIIVETTAIKDPRYEDIPTYIDNLSKKLSSKYWSKNQNYIFPMQWQHKKGLYRSTVRINNVDRTNKLITELIRSKIFKIDDNNMFVTNFVLYGQLQAEQLRTLKIDHHRFSQSLMAISDFRDKNSPPGIPKYVFWSQKLVNGTWSASPYNLMKCVNIFLPFDLSPIAQFVLVKIGLGFLVFADGAKHYFIIPPDNDDSSVNLALLGYLKETNSSHYDFWNTLNYKKDQYYDIALRYAYRPFNPNKTLNDRADQIDPRTYFALRGFLDELVQNASATNSTPELILPTTWLLTNNQSKRGIEAMPLNANNVDASVCANFIFGISFQLLQNQITMHEQLKKMILDTVNLLQYTVKSIIKVRPDLILVYYPSKYDFYWFVARTINLLKRYSNLPEPLPEVFDRLQALMKTTGTQHILDEAIAKKGTNHWHQFLGNYAGKVRDDDAVFSTGVALNALMDTWTTRKGKKVKYDKDTPEKVKTTIEKGVSYLLQTLNKKHEEMNAFFSGSVKLFTSMPFFFPANVHKTTNGTDFDPNAKKVDLDDPLGMQYYVKGYVEKATYDHYLTLTWFGQNVPEKYVDLNTKTGLPFPFWSSAAVTQIHCITSLSKFMRLQEQE